LDAFLASVEKRAFRMAEIATSNKDEAMDILQDAMFKLAEKYADRDAKEWAPLFTTILQSRIKDWYRRNQVRNRFRSWFSNKDNEQEDPIQQVEDEKARTPEQLLQADRRVDELDLAIHALPLRQQQAFLLRTWEGYSVEETAQAMKCSTGSVKTHYSRAVHSLRDRLDEHWG
jgi:RNA polymerase sigma-70 factor, ECF subfamily